MGLFFFQRTLFPRYPDLSLRLFGYMHYSSGSTTVDRISHSAFKLQVDRLLSIMSDEDLIEVYVKVSSRWIVYVKFDIVR